MVDGWFGMTVATVFVLTTLLCAVSLAAHGPRRGRRIAAAEANHVVMGVAMVLMATPVTAGLVPAALGAAVFAAAGAGWLAVLVVARRRGEALGSAIGVDRCTAHPTHLALVDASMVVMYLAMAPAAPASSATPEMAMPGMDMTEHATHGAPPVGLLVLAAMLALYLVAHAVATVVVVARRTRAAQAPEPATLAVGTPAGTAGGAAVAEAPALPRAVSVLAHGPVQLIGQAGMSLAMAVMLCLL
ncbi:DUF5134 domain-containing protein [Actinomycetospora sp. TBRC 11914]|uniref:DUF5134 domain-containing protein n=1 Tax=Actinomycetospora sp. TBRC 11914 TaxID=2729387 RepID=UPI00145ECD78|nr:DUF5134 domain-containing protein [Actinomycetospora sp. TBRC 11914]NMO92657.1 DUF5134 domain-containing protein [Actinomycetospora sp. TBRC 11914]